MYSVPSPPPQWNNPSQTLLGRSTDATPPPPPSSPTSPIRSGRLRGLSYLRTYTHNHLLSRDNHNHNNTSNNQQRPSTVARATSYPSPTPTTSPSSSSGNRGLVSPASHNLPPSQTSPAAQQPSAEVTSARSSNPDSLRSTNGWLPTVGGQSVASRIASEPQSSTTASSSAVLAGITSLDTSGLTNSMGRTRSATASSATPQADGIAHNESPVQTNTPGNGMNHHLPSIRFTAHQDPRAQRPSLVFSPMARILPTGSEIIKVGRYSERENQPPQAINVPSKSPVGFKSKVVSRRHCEFWCSAGRWFIRDVKSSSGTFLNHVRLSSPGTESPPYPVKDGDIVQLGIDFKGGEEMIFRCVKIRVELDKGWQNGPSSFNVQSHKRLRELNSFGAPAKNGPSQDCSICLGPIAPCQSLFVAPCSHTWHYKCIRVIINGPHWPQFTCPNCRCVADLEAELDDPFADGEWQELDEEAREAREATVAPEESPVVSRSTRQASSSEATQAINEEPEDDLSPSPGHDNSDAELADASDGSEVAGMNEAATSVEDLHAVDETSASLSSSQESNATVRPVDIIGRKPVSSSSVSRSATQRASRRTSSPNSLLPDAMPGVEGPLTPRNDAGPYIFDGSAGVGRAAAINYASVAGLNLNDAADSPTSTTTQPQTAT